MHRRYEELWTQVREQVQQTSQATQATIESGRNAWARWWSTVLPSGKPLAEPPVELPRRVALALGGGGGKGGAHLGVLQVLEEQGVPVDAVAGTSIGGAVAVFYAAGFSLDQVATLFQSFTLRRIATTDPTRTGFIGSRKREQMLIELLGDRTFADLRMPCAVVTVDLISGREVVIDEGPLVPAVMATTALPAVFPPEVRGSQLLADGGVVNNLPVDVAARMGGPARVIAVQLRDAALTYEPMVSVPANPLARLTLAPRQFAIANRALAILMDQATELRLAQHPPAVWLCPDVGHISLLDMTRLEEGHRAGEEAARAALEQLLALRAWRLSEQRAEALVESEEVWMGSQPLQNP
ncbi:MAG TPA: patatin-like phospholipase family protein [Roseiflexaceae bacterium]|nr:patatin-like phospholipase family protein [Roseiflexaceae bacterium]